MVTDNFDVKFGQGTDPTIYMEECINFNIFVFLLTSCHTQFGCTLKCKPWANKKC